MKRSKAAGDGIVQTANVRDDGVLNGIMRREVISHCMNLGFRVLERAANLEESSQWHEAFFTNS